MGTLHKHVSLCILKVRDIRFTECSIKTNVSFIKMPSQLMFCSMDSTKQGTQHYKLGGRDWASMEGDISFVQTNKGSLEQSGLN